MRLLILEDITGGCGTRRARLRGAGISFEARRVATLADFLEALDSFHADLIIADYNLPDIDGLTAVRLVDSGDSALPVLLVTGVLDDEAAAAVVKAGATDYVRKDRLARLPMAVEGALAAAASSAGIAAVPTRNCGPLQQRAVRLSLDNARPDHRLDE